jgi:hypothetical protein
MTRITNSNPNKKQRNAAISKLMTSELTIAGVVTSVLLLLLSASIFSSTTALQGQSIEAFAQKQQGQSSSSPSPLPQPNSNNTLLKATATNALFEPAAGLSNVFGPKGLFPFTNVFKCANSLTCGGRAGKKH